MKWTKYDDYEDTDKINDTRSYPDIDSLAMDYYDYSFQMAGGVD